MKAGPAPMRRRPARRLAPGEREQGQERALSSRVAARSAGLSRICTGSPRSPPHPHPPPNLARPPPVPPASPPRRALAARRGGAPLYRRRGACRTCAPACQGPATAPGVAPSSRPPRVPSLTRARLGGAPWRRGAARPDAGNLGPPFGQRRASVPPSPPPTASPAPLARACMRRPILPRAASRAARRSASGSRLRISFATAAERGALRPPEARSRPRPKRSPLHPARPFFGIRSTAQEGGGEGGRRGAGSRRRLIRLRESGALRARFQGLALAGPSGLRRKNAFDAGRLASRAPKGPPPAAWPHLSPRRNLSPPARGAGRGEGGRGRGKGGEGRCRGRGGSGRRRGWRDRPAAGPARSLSPLPGGRRTARGRGGGRERGVTRAGPVVLRRRRAHAHARTRARARRDGLCGAPRSACRPEAYAAGPARGGPYSSAPGRFPAPGPCACRTAARAGGPRRPARLPGRAAPCRRARGPGAPRLPAARTSIPDGRGATAVLPADAALARARARAPMPAAKGKIWAGWCPRRWLERAPWRGKGALGSGAGSAPPAAPRRRAPPPPPPRRRRPAAPRR